MKTLTLTLICMSVFLCGCSDFRFVNATQKQEEDARELLRLVKPHAELTSGSIVSSRLVADEAVYSDKRRVLELTTMTLYNFDSAGKQQGQTISNHGVAYLAASPALNRNRNDVELTGRVIHDAMMTDGTSVTKVHVETEEMLWDPASGYFKGTSPFDALMEQENKSPMRMKGKNFIATKNMRRWIIGGGNFGNDSLGDLQALADKTRKELETSSTVVTADAAGREEEVQAMREKTFIETPSIEGPNSEVEGASTVTLPTVKAPAIFQNQGVPLRDALTP